MAGEKGTTEVPPVQLDFPKEKQHGEFTTTVAFSLAHQLKSPPLEIAGRLRDFLQTHIRPDLRRKIRAITVEKPGFINFSLTEEALADIIRRIQKEGKDFGRSRQGKRKKILVEFVSANPTGPLSVAHGRQAAIGDSLANILAFCGFRVRREYYLNDEGNQIDCLGRSTLARYRELKGGEAALPEDGYQGEYVKDVAREIGETFTGSYLNTRAESVSFFAHQAVKIILRGIRKDLEDFGVKFDTWFSQKKLVHDRQTPLTFSRLDRDGYLYRQDGALWFRSTRFGDDKDRVIVKSDGSTTYLWSDIAYHREKYRRGFKRLINLWGPDHHGYIGRMKAAVQALGYPADSLTVVIVQLATLYRGGTPVRMSTRAGEFVTLREVMDEVGRDACRFFFLMRRNDSHLDFDLELAKQQSPENPVYYVQYAHARIRSIFDFAAGRRRGRRQTADLSRLTSEEEKEILRLLIQFPRTVRSAAEGLEPCRLVGYLQTLAAAFHQFYHRSRVVTGDAELSSARLLLVDSVAIVLANGLRLLGIAAPKKM